MGQKWVETHFSPTSNPFRDFRENPLFSQFKGGGNCFLKRALKQSRPSIRVEWIFLCKFGPLRRRRRATTKTAKNFLKQEPESCMIHDVPDACARLHDELWRSLATLWRTLASPQRHIHENLINIHQSSDRRFTTLHQSSGRRCLLCVDGLQNVPNILNLSSFGQSTVGC